MYRAAFTESAFKRCVSVFIHTISMYCAHNDHSSMRVVQDYGPLHLRLLRTITPYGFVNTGRLPRQLPRPGEPERWSGFRTSDSLRIAQQGGIEILGFCTGERRC